MDLQSAIFNFILVFILSITHKTESQTHNDVVNIYRNITNGYQKEFFPTGDQSKPMDLHFQMIPLNLNSFSEIEETISMIMSIFLYWEDPQLSWNHTLYGGKTDITIVPDHIWLPKVSLANSVDSILPIGGEPQFYATVVHNGTVLWATGDVLNAKCPTNILKFPFDSQTCVFNFIMWNVDNKVVKYICDSEMGEMAYFTPNSNWKVTMQRQYVANLSNIMSIVVFKISVKRQPLYYIIIVILPILMFSLMNPLVFLLPVESGERVSLGMTILLSYAVFLTLVANSVPASSSPICALLLVMILIMILSGLIVICVIVSVYYYYIDDISDVHSCLRRLALCYKCAKSRQYLESNASCDQINITGKDLIKCLDNVFLIISYMFIVVVLSMYFLYVLAM